MSRYEGRKRFRGFINTHVSVLIDGPGLRGGSPGYGDRFPTLVPRPSSLVPFLRRPGVPVHRLVGRRYAAADRHGLVGGSEAREVLLAGEAARAAAGDVVRAQALQIAQH